MVAVDGVEPSHQAYEAQVLTLETAAPRLGIEPSKTGFGDPSVQPAPKALSLSFQAVRWITTI